MNILSEQQMPKVKPPAFQFYADDFVAGTVEMTVHEIGAYILLLCYEWSKGFVPDNDDAIRRICRETQAFDLTNIRCKFVSRRGKLFNVRMERERKKQNDFRVNRSESGKKGAESRWLSHSVAIGTAMHQPLAKNGSPSPSPSPNTKEEGSTNGDPNRFFRMKGEICVLMNRQSARLTHLEESTLAEIARRSESEAELKELIAFKVKPEAFFPESIESLVSNWDKTLDRARNYEINRRNNSKGIDRNTGTLNSGKASQYSGMGKVVRSGDAPRSAT